MPKLSVSVITGASITIVLLAMFTGMLAVGLLGSTSYCFLVTIATLAGIAVAAFPRLKELNLREMRIVLHEMKTTRNEIRAVVMPLTELIAFTSVNVGRWPPEGSMQEAQKLWIQQKVSEISAALQSDAVDTERVLRFFKKYQEIDAVLTSGALQRNDPAYETQLAQVHSLRAQIEAMLRADLPAQINSAAH